MHLVRTTMAVLVTLVGMVALVGPAAGGSTIQIGNLVWHDLDADGVQDGAEPGLAGLSVQLWNAAKSQLLDQDSTDSGGRYRLDAPGPGSYRVRVVLPTISAQFSPKDVGGNTTASDTIDSDINPSGGDIGFTDAISLGSNVISISKIDAGVQLPRVGDLVWRDTDGDGIKDADESGFGGVTVTLLDGSSPTTVLATTTTDAQGRYRLPVSGASSYIVKVVIPDGFAATDRNIGTNEAIDSDIDADGATSPFSASLRDDVDAGLVSIIQIGNLVWHDLDADGVQDGAEPGLAGLSVQLWNAAKSQLLDQDSTDSGGRYRLDAPGPGSYRVRVVLPTISAQFSPKDVGGNTTASDTIDSDINPSGGDIGFTDAISLGSNVISISNIDAGVQLPRTTTTITAHTPAPSVVGQAVQITVSVTETVAGAPTGRVTVSDGTQSCRASLLVGHCDLVFLKAGKVRLTATYPGSDTFAPSTSAAVVHNVEKASTATTLSAHTPSPSTAGEPVTVTFTVAAVAPGGGTPSGTVTVSDGVDTCSGTVAAGQCTITLSTIGARTLTASYAGSATHLASASVGVSHQVNPPPPTARFSRSPGSGTVPFTVHFDASASSGASAITGFAWDFGDGETATGAVVDHTFTTAGLRTVTLTVTDSTGGTDDATKVVRAYAFAWVAPIVARPARNGAVAGTVVKVKFRLGADFGLGVLKNGFPVSQRFRCGDGSLVAGTRAQTTPDGAGLTYNAATGVYTYRWSTPASWGDPSKACRRLEIRFQGGLKQTADFTFRRPGTAASTPAIAEPSTTEPTAAP